MIGDLRVPVPPVEEQVSMARKLNDLSAVTDQVAWGLAKQSALLQERKQALITAAVTGQLDLARNIAEEAS